MDPVTAVCNVLTAFLAFASQRFAASTPAQQAVLTTIDTQIIQDLVALADKVHDQAASAAEKVKGLFGQPKTLGPTGQAPAP